MGNANKKNRTSFVPGQAPIPGAGRKKGTPNKKTKEFMEMLERNNFDPGEEYVVLFREMKKIYQGRLKAKNIAGALTALSEAGVVLNNICQFVYPKKKAVEHTGEVGVLTFADFIASGADEPEID